VNQRKTVTLFVIIGVIALGFPALVVPELLAHPGDKIAVAIAVFSFVPSGLGFLFAALYGGLFD
jgi:hypothetical protein